MLKASTSDETEVASELCLSTALTDPIQCLTAIIRTIVESVLFDWTHSSTNLRDMRHIMQQQAQLTYAPINKTFATVLAKMLVRAMILLLWANEWSINATRQSDKISELNDENKDLVLDSITNVFKQFDKTINGGCLVPSVTFLIFFIHELAKAPRNKYSQKLVEMIPTHLIFSLARLDSASLPLSMFMQLYNVDEEKYKLPCLKYACLMRNVGLV